jgi:hypothetical protein
MIIRRDKGHRLPLREISFRILHVKVTGKQDISTVIGSEDDTMDCEFTK